MHVATCSKSLEASRDSQDALHLILRIRLQLPVSLHRGGKLSDMPPCTEDAPLHAGSLGVRPSTKVCSRHTQTVARTLCQPGLWQLQLILPHGCPLFNQAVGVPTAPKPCQQLLFLQ